MLDSPLRNDHSPRGPATQDGLSLGRLAEGGAQRPSILDIKSNDLAALKRKVELLEVPLDKEPYLAFYLKNASSFDPDMFAYLLGKGADPNLADDRGSMPLHWAVLARDLSKVKTLVAAKASLSAKTRYGWSYEDRFEEPEDTTPLELARLLQKASDSDSVQKDCQAIIDWLKSQPSKK